MGGIIKSKLVQFLIKAVDGWKDLVVLDLAKFEETKRNVLQQVLEEPGGTEADCGRLVSVVYRGLELKDIAVSGHLEEIHLQLMAIVKGSAVTQKLLDATGAECMLALQMPADAPAMPNLGDDLLAKAFCFLCVLPSLFLYELKNKYLLNLLEGPPWSLSVGCAHQEEGHHLF